MTPGWVGRGEPGNALERDELEDEAMRLATNRAGATEDEMTAIVRQGWAPADLDRIPTLL